MPRRSVLLPSSVIILLVIWGLATLVPSLALTVRRLHDGNFSGWLLLLVLVPFLGALAVLVFTILPSNPAGQRFDQPGGVLRALKGSAGTS